MMRLCDPRVDRRLVDARKAEMMKEELDAAVDAGDAAVIKPPDQAARQEAIQPS
jgi:hypothetical protein